MKCVLYLDDPKSEFAECDPNDCDRIARRYHPKYDEEEEKSDSDFPPTKDTRMNKFIGSLNEWQFLLFILFFISSPFIVSFVIYYIMLKVLIVWQSNILTVVVFLICFHLVMVRKYKREIIDGYPELKGGKTGEM